jgi:hypothetical protein
MEYLNNVTMGDDSASDLNYVSLQIILMKP